MPRRVSYQRSRFLWTIMSVVDDPTKWCSTRSYSHSQFVVTGTDVISITWLIALVRFLTGVGGGRYCDRCCPLPGVQGKV